MASYTIRAELKDQTDRMRTELLFTMLDNGFLAAWYVKGALLMRSPQTNLSMSVRRRSPF